MSELADLEQLVLGSNQFNGQIPTIIGRMTKLQSVDLSNNTFSSTLPSEMGNLKDLISLNVESNPEISGSIPDSFAELDFLEQLQLRNTNITAGLNEVYCSQDILITEIQADCAANGDSDPTVPSMEKIVT
ncbi:MAG: hypothetical protein SGARI_003105 [Bacillariaceae sp.]